MKSSIQITGTVGDGHTLQEFQKVIQQRMKYMHETARDSIAACAIQALKSIRTVTKVAKPNSIKVDVAVDSSLCASGTREGGRNTFCVRNRTTGQRYVGQEQVRRAEKAPCRNLHVFRFTDDYGKQKKHYLILATTSTAARKYARKIVAKRLLAYSGLAKRALGVLMMKTSTVRVNDPVSTTVNAKAFEKTDRKEVVARSTDGNGGKYGLILNDDLRYALDAIKGGRGQVDAQLKKAMNKVVGLMIHKLEKKGQNGFLGFGKLKTPFPEVRKGKK